MYIIEDENQAPRQSEQNDEQSRPVTDVEKHFNILGLLYILVNALLFIPAAIVFFVLLGAGILSDEPAAFLITTGIGTFIGVLLVALALPGIIGGWGLLKGKLWAKYLVLVLGILNLFSFPVGTALGIYTIWVMTRPKSGVLGDLNVTSNSSP